jgi:hypothetical protein
LPNEYTFLESDLRFEFDPANWQVRKYDDHPFFHGFSGVGLKGVDFIANYQAREVWLLEVKNYRTLEFPHRRKEVDLALQAPDRIVESLEEKYIDTMAGIRAIHTYYQRKVRRPLGWLKYRLRLDPEQIFWREVCRLALDEKQLRLALWLEADPSDWESVRKIAKRISVPSELHGQRVQVFFQGGEAPPPHLQVYWQIP